MTGASRSEYVDCLRAEGRSEAYIHGFLEGALSVPRKALADHLTGLTPEQWARIEACNDLQQLREWVLKLLKTRSAAEILGD